MRTNPFSTRYIQPGALQYLLPEGTSLQSLATQFIQQHHSRAAIIGPHGSGKSTLLQSLVPLLGTLQFSTDPPIRPQKRDANLPDRDIRWFRFMAGGGGSQQLMKDRSHWNHRTLLVIDGWEQLHWWRRWWIALATRSCRAGLLVTAHHKTMLPTLWQTDVSAPLACQVIEQLLDRDHGVSLPIDPAVIEKQLQQNAGSLRELLFSLYDDVENLVRQKENKPKR